MCAAAAIFRAARVSERPNNFGKFAPAGSGLSACQRTTFSEASETNEHSFGIFLIINSQYHPGLTGAIVPASTSIYLLGADTDRTPSCRIRRRIDTRQPNPCLSFPAHDHDGQYFIMRSRLPSFALLSALASLILLLLSTTASVGAHMIELGPHSSECFFEDLHHGDQMTLTYQVGGGGHLDIDTVLYDPHSRPLFKQERKDTGTYSFTAQDDGRYTYCFSNDFSTVSDKTVSFNVHGIIYVPDEGDMLPIEREIRDLAAGLQAVKDEQEYLVIRERVHRNSKFPPHLLT